MASISTTSNANNANPANNIDDDSKSRTRVSQACTRCRSRKDRCDGLRPSCTACASVGKACIYESTTKKRGLPEGYVRGLEKLLALATKTIDGLEDVIGDILNHDQVRKSWNSTAGDELHSVWKESQVLRDLESILSDAAQQTTGQKRKRQADNEDDDTPDPRSISPKSLNLQYRILAGGTSAPEKAIPTSIGSFQLPQNARQLLDHYFAHTHCWFPVLNRPQILKKFYGLSRSNTPLQEHEQVQDGDLATIWAILAYSSAQMQGRDQPFSSAEHRDTAQRFITIAHLCIPRYDESCSIAHAQALLIIALFSLGQDQWITASMYVGNAVRIMLALQAKQKLGQNSKNGRAILQGCFILDVAVAMYLRSTPHMQPVHLAGGSYMEEDGHEEWEPWCPPGRQAAEQEPSFSISTFNQLTRIFLIIAQSVPETEGDAQPSAVRAKLERLHQLVHSGFAGSTVPSSHSPPHHVYLQLTHLLAQLYLVSQPFDVGSGPVERAKLSCNVLSLVELCANSSTLGLAQIPPILADTVHLAIYQAETSQTAFGPTYGLPTYDEFVTAAGGYQYQLSQTWPVFSASEERNGVSLPPQSKRASHAYDNANNRPTPILPISTPIPFSDSARPIPEAITTNDFQDGTTMNPPLQLNTTQYDSWNTTQQAFQPPPPLEQPLVPVQSNPIEPSPSRPRAPSTATVMSQNPRAGPGLLATSPSFAGDEIDAIFHEMAQLDANEWTNERALGLKEFGFSDEMAFQAFCNDPERVTAAPYDMIQPALSSNKQTWTFTEHGQ